ncbi:hypothetical protein CNMCM5793_000862 [Aspergillus hiratsukae]|uniref:Uncharacterized protein n=1 Tax=Aspergillus hiratsukae TaxID=1194566 RepID=A0A8H6PAJ8_9EURO|nr:hypothetical protein CNMCM5793_000862 [Aspergillus hiratsukae]KAF7163104.1 hypothetical protein CNMCM6106_000136 [Aspergillus hiratsukae]
MSDPHSNPNPSFGFPTPPDSPRKRRTLLRESEESEGTMEIEQYLTSCDPYRSTNLPHFWPYPLMYTRSEELQRTLLPIDDDIRTILRTHGLPEHRHMPFIAQKPHYPGGDTAVKLLYVMLLAEDNHPRRLGPAKDALARLLNEKSVTDMFIEIVNIDLCFQPSLFPMSREHGLVVGFQEGKQRIIDLLQATLGDSWRLLCPFNVGRVESEARPAVVILVDPLTRANWSVEVEFIPGIVDFLKDGSFAGKMDRPAMGASVGIRGDSDTNSGTLGGFVTLTKGDKVLKGFLTNYHVFMAAANTEVECFSRLDTQATQSDLDEKISNMDQSIEIVSNKILDRQAMGSGSTTTGLRTQLDHLKSLVDGWRRERQNVSQMPHPMGEVTAAALKLRQASAMGQKHVYTGRAKTESDSFVEDGDSGSFVVDTDGNVCGLIFGGFSGRCGPSSGDNYYVNAGLVTPISDVAKSVKLRTVRKDHAAYAPVEPFSEGLEASSHP